MPWPRIRFSLGTLFLCVTCLCFTWGLTQSVGVCDCQDDAEIRLRRPVVAVAASPVTIRVDRRFERGSTDTDGGLYYFWCFGIKVRLFDYRFV